MIREEQGGGTASLGRGDHIWREGVSCVGATERPGWLESNGTTFCCREELCSVSSFLSLPQPITLNPPSSCCLWDA